MLLTMLALAFCVGQIPAVITLDDLNALTPLDAGIRVGISGEEVDAPSGLLIYVLCDDANAPPPEAWDALREAGAAGESLQIVGPVAIRARPDRPERLRQAVAVSQVEGVPTPDRPLRVAAVALDAPGEWTVEVLAPDGRVLAERAVAAEEAAVWVKMDGTPAGPTLGSPVVLDADALANRSLPTLAAAPGTMVASLDGTTLRLAAERAVFTRGAAADCLLLRWSVNGRIRLPELALPKRMHQAGEQVVDVIDLDLSGLITALDLAPGDRVRLDAQWSVGGTAAPAGAGGLRQAVQAIQAVAPEGPLVLAAEPILWRVSPE